MEGLAAKDVAEALGMSVGAVYTAKCRVLDQLKQTIQRIEEGIRIMTAKHACPDPSRLRELLGDTLPENEQTKLIEHLDGCVDCQSRLEQAVDGSKLLDAFRPSSDAEPRRPCERNWVASSQS